MPDERVCADCRVPLMDFEYFYCAWCQPDEEDEDE